MSVQLTPSKRPYAESVTEPNGKGKLQKLGAQLSHDFPLKSNDGCAVVRILCPTFKIASLTEQDDSIISQIQKETGTKIKVEEPVPGWDERVVVITGSDEEKEVNGDHSKKDDGQTTETQGDDANEIGGDDKKGQAPGKDLQPDEKISSVQKALLLVFERILESEPEVDGEGEESNKPAKSVARLIVVASQVGCLLGKGGSVIKQMSSESGAQIRVLPRDKLPPSAFSSDEVVQISGDLDAVRNALQSVSQQLMENSLKDHESLSANPSCPSSHTHTMSNHRFPTQATPFATGPRDGESRFPGRMNNMSQDILTFHLLCQVEKVGGVIGKGGTVVKALQHETGCEIKVLEGLADLDPENRIIAILGPAHPAERISAPQDAVLRVLSRIVRATPESKDNAIVAKLLVSSNQIGCLLGKGGSIIAEMRKVTGAYIRILGKDQIPKCASENEEVVQINGVFEAVQEALLHITARLRNHFFRDAFPSINHPFDPAIRDQGPPFMDQVPPFGSFVGRREFSPPGMYSNFGPSFPKFDPVGGLPPHGGFGLHDDGLPFMHNFHRPVAPHHVPEKLPSSAPWGTQELIDGGGPIGFPEYAGPPQRRFGGASNPAIITNTTMEVVVPRSVVPAIYGEDGGCLEQIREISDAKITITNPKPGAAETVIIISGSPEQTHAAQSLIQAFVIVETQAP